MTRKKPNCFFFGVPRHLGLLGVVWFEAADEVRLADRERFHEGIQGLAELTAEGWHLLAVVGRGLREQERRAQGGESERGSVVNC